MFYRRHLPHWQKADSALFVTWRLHGSLPRRTLSASLKESNLGKRFLLLDQELDRAAYGPTWLKDVRLATAVVNALLHGADQLDLYRLSAYVVMSNHVHILIWPKALLYRITKSIKGYTAHECNKLLDRAGKKFWQDESFDHAVRNEDQFYRIKRYIERNPVNAGLVESPEDWPWSSAGRSNQ
ncbi:MAG: transposase [Pyrinomonadaceae bacterium]|nr:transposase [Pyrinomonadaceae bacterium]